MALNPNDRYYVYLLHRTPGELTSLEDVFYVGKGVGSRVLHHFGDAVRESVHEVREGSVGDGSSAVLSKADAVLSKAETIRQMLRVAESSKAEDFATIVAGGLTEVEAFRLEAVVLELLQRFRLAELTNLVAGHGQSHSLMPLTTARRFLQCSDIDVEKVSARQLAASAPSQENLVLCVKVSAAPFEGEREFASTGELGHRGGSVAWRPTGRLIDRVGWDPHAPWTPAEALRRAEKWWGFSEATVAYLQQVASCGRLKLAAAVPDVHTGRSAIAYVWDVANGPWGIGRDVRGDGHDGWVVPVGRHIDEHPMLGGVPVNAETGQGILQGNAGGWGLFVEPELNQAD